MKCRTDTALMIVTAVFVAGLAIVAGAISFAHMWELATAHDQTEWKSYAFPISVDGLEIVASLFLVAQRRAGRATGPIPWIALIVGTAASLAANVAVGGADPIGKALAGWPAISMLVSIKLLFAMIDHHAKMISRRSSGTISGRSRPSPQPSMTVPSTVHQTGRDDRDDKVPSTTVPAEPTNSPAPSATDPADSGGRAAPVDIGTVAHLIAAARAALARGRPVVVAGQSR